MSILEEGTNSTEIPMMGVFNNLVMYDQHVAQNSLASIVPDLATSWSSSEDGNQLTFHLREDVRWHDGNPAGDPGYEREKGAAICLVELSINSSA